MMGGEGSGTAGRAFAVKGLHPAGLGLPVLHSALSGSGMTAAQTDMCSSLPSTGDFAGASA